MDPLAGWLARAGWQIVPGEGSPDAGEEPGNARIMPLGAQAGGAPQDEKGQKVLIPPPDVVDPPIAEPPAIPPVPDIPAFPTGHSGLPGDGFLTYPDPLALMQYGQDGGQYDPNGGQYGLDPGQYGADGGQYGADGGADQQQVMPPMTEAELAAMGFAPPGAQFGAEFGGEFGGGEFGAAGEFGAGFGAIVPAGEIGEFGEFGQGMGEDGMAGQQLVQYGDCTKVCSACDEHKTRDQFAPSYWYRTCRECWQCKAHKKGRGVSSPDAPCAGCGMSLPPAMFDVIELSKGMSAKCKGCVATPCGPGHEGEAHDGGGEEEPPHDPDSPTKKCCTCGKYRSRPYFFPSFWNRQSAQCKECRRDARRKPNPRLVNPWLDKNAGAKIKAAKKEAALKAMGWIPHKTEATSEAPPVLRPVKVKRPATSVATVVVKRAPSGKSSVVTKMVTKTKVLLKGKGKAKGKAKAKAFAKKSSNSEPKAPAKSLAKNSIGTMPSKCKVEGVKSKLKVMTVKTQPPSSKVVVKKAIVKQMPKREPEEEEMLPQGGEEPTDRSCISCGESKGKDDYSVRQWTLILLPKCSACMSVQQQASVRRTKQCRKCLSELPRACFTPNQWAQPLKTGSVCASCSDKKRNKNPLAIQGVSPEEMMQMMCKDERKKTKTESTAS